MGQLSSLERRYLSRMGSKMKPAAHIGREGLTPQALGSVTRGLEAKELIKVRINPNCELDRAALADKVAKDTTSELVTLVGRNFLLFKRRLQNSQIVFPANLVSRTERKREQHQRPGGPPRHEGEDRRQRPAPRPFTRIRNAFGQGGPQRGGYGDRGVSERGYGYRGSAERGGYGDRGATRGGPTRGSAGYGERPLRERDENFGNRAYGPERASVPRDDIGNRIYSPRERGGYGDRGPSRGGYGDRGPRKRFSR